MKSGAATKILSSSGSISLVVSIGSWGRRAEDVPRSSCNVRGALAAGWEKAQDAVTCFAAAIGIGRRSSRGWSRFMRRSSIYSILEQHGKGELCLDPAVIAPMDLQGLGSQAFVHSGLSMDFPMQGCLAVRDLHRARLHIPRMPLPRRGNWLGRLGSPIATPTTAIFFLTISDLDAENRIVAVSAFRGFAESSGLSAHGPRYCETSRRAAICVVKILQNAAQDDLPVERPTTLELVVNLGTAAALGITIPQSIPLRADESH